MTMRNEISHLLLGLQVEQDSTVETWYEAIPQSRLDMDASYESILEATVGIDVRNQ